MNRKIDDLSNLWQTHANYPLTGGNVDVSLTVTGERKAGG